MTSHESVSSRPFACRFCDYRAKRSCRLREHELIHSNLKQFACGHEGCSYRGTTSSDVKKHMLSHTAQRPHNCNLCHNAFRRLDRLREHMEKKHPGEPLPGK